MQSSLRLGILHDDSISRADLRAFVGSEFVEIFTVADDSGDTLPAVDVLVLVLETAEQTLKHAAEVYVPVVAIVDPADVATIKVAETCVVLTKPVSRTELFEQAVEFAIERHRLKRELKASRDEVDRMKREHSLLPKSAPEIIARLDRDLRHVYVNDAVERAIGLPTEQILGKTNRELGIDERLCTLWEAKTSEVFITGAQVSHEFEYTTPAGVRHFLARLAPEFDADGKVVSVLSVATDITDRKRFENQLHRSERLFRATFDNAAVGIAHVDLDGRWLRVNDRLCEIVGYERNDLLTRTFQQVTHPEDLEEDLALVTRLLAREIPNYSLEKRYIRGNGELVWVNLTVSLFCDDESQPTFLSIVEDITDRKEAEKALKHIESSRAMALQAGRMGVWEWEIDSGRLRWSSTMEAVYGLAPHEFPAVADDFFAIIHGDDLPGLHEALNRALGQGPDFRAEFRARHADGGYRWFAVQGRVLHDHDGRPIGLSGVSWDINEAKLGEQALKEADRRKNEFLAMLAHELRNPLAAIRNAADLLKLRPEDDPEVRWSHDVIGRQTVHLNRLIDDLLDVSRISQGKIPLQRSLIDLREVVRRTVDDIQPILAAKNHRLEMSLPDVHLPVQGDPHRLEQVIGNLITNASKYTDPGGLIRASARLVDGDVVVAIRDNGVGIRPEMLDSIFGLFVQADNSLDRAQGGLGIGLTLVKMLTELHGGSVSAASEGAGKGSEFTIRLPAISVPASELVAATNGSSVARLADKASSRRILLVDDNADSARGLARLLRVHGHHVDVAYDSLEGLSVASQIQPNVFLLDIGLPGMNGYDLARKLRQNPEFSSAVFIAVSGYGQDNDRARSNDAGFHHHLIKPVDFDVLADLLAHAN